MGKVAVEIRLERRRPRRPRARIHPPIASSADTGCLAGRLGCCFGDQRASFQRYKSLAGRIRIGRQRLIWLQPPSDLCNACNRCAVARISAWFPPPQINPRILKAKSSVLARWRGLQPVNRTLNGLVVLGPMALGSVRLQRSDGCRRHLEIARLDWGPQCYDTSSGHPETDCSSRSAPRRPSPGRPG